MKGVSVSGFLLERYHIGEVTPEEKQLVEEALAKDNDLAAALAKLDHADNKFFQQYPQEKFFTDEFNSRLKNTRRLYLRRNYKFICGICAAALVLIIALPMLIFRNPDFRNPGQNEFGDRMKGGTRSEPSTSEITSESNNIMIDELSVYIRGNSTRDVFKLADKSGVREGDTVQLVYRVSGDKHGIIFSVDGRSYVTLHYPYNVRQTTKLISGKTIPLDEAYTLDDAPDYEIFFFITADMPMNVSNIIAIAEQLALQIKGRSEEALQIGIDTFKDYEVNVFTLRKE